MKQTDLIRKLETLGCLLVRHGGKHDGIAIPKPEYPNQCRGTGK
jgi:hypothetical protein